MQIIFLFIVIWALFSKLRETETFEQKVKRMNNDPSCSLKSNKWLKTHPEWKGGYKL